MSNEKKSKSCPHAKSDMTPCYLRDDEVAVYEYSGQKMCVGCEKNLDTLASTEPAPEQPTSEGEDCEFCNGDGIIRGEALGGKVVEVAYCPNQCEPSTTEGEPTNRELADWLILHTAKGRHAYPPSHQWYKIAASRLALLAQPQEQPTIAPGKKWTPAALEEWTPEQWANALDAARTDLMCAEDFEPSDVAHVMNICAQVLRRPREPIGYIEEDDIGRNRGYVHLTPNPSRVAVYVRPTEED